LDARSALRISLGQVGDTLNLQYGLAEMADEDQRCYLLDFDYFLDEKTEIEGAKNVISRLYGYSGPAFQWAISRRLHEAMEPRV